MAEHCRVVETCHSLAGIFFLAASPWWSAACHRLWCYWHPKLDGSVRKQTKRARFPLAGMSEAVFKIRNVVFRLVSRWKQTWWKSSLFYFAESNSGLGFRTKSIIGTECYLISPQMLFSLPHRLYSTFALPWTDARRTPRYCYLLHGSIPDLEGRMVKRMVLILNSKSLYEAINNTAWLANIFLLCQYI